MEYREVGNLIFIRLHQDDDLFECLKDVCEACEVNVCIVVSGIGMLKKAELKYFIESGNYSPLLYPEPLELVSLTGNIIRQDGDYQFHLHAVLAGEDKSAVAGHLSKGKVNATNEIVLLKTDIPARRELDEATGLMALTFR